jgi:hypothetical protein
MKWIVLSCFIVSSAWAKPPKKANKDEVKVTESFSVASLGLESEAFRIQILSFQGKNTYKIARLVGGNLDIEHDVPVVTYNQMKGMVQSLLKMESNEDCKTPMRFTFRTGKSEDQLKLCYEKSNVSGPMKRFTEKAKKVLGVKKEEKAAEEPVAEPESTEKPEEPLPE